MMELFGVQWGSISQFLTALFSAGIFGAVLTFVINMKKVKVDANDKLLIHLNEELDRLAAAQKDYDAREAALAKRQRECEEREQQLRARVRKLEDELEGVYRTLVATSADKVIELGVDVFPAHVIELAKRTLKAQGHRIPRILEQKNGVN